MYVCVYYYYILLNIFSLVHSNYSAISDFKTNKAVYIKRNSKGTFYFRIAYVAEPMDLSVRYLYI